MDIQLFLGLFVEKTILPPLNYFYIRYVFELGLIGLVFGCGTQGKERAIWCGLG